MELRTFLGGRPNSMTLAKVITINRTPGDFVSATRHLSVEDRGAYQEILDQIVLIGQDEEPPSLPNDDRSIANMLGWPVVKWRKTKERLCTGMLAVLIAENGRISQTRIVTEIEEARKRIGRSSNAGKASATSRQSKRVALRERMRNPSSTQVAAKLQLEPARRRNLASSSHELRVMSHEEETTLPSSASFLPADGDEAVAIVSKTLQAIAPRLVADDIAVSLWLRDICRDPWWLAAAICERMESIQTARTDRYVTTMLQGMNREGWTCDDARGFVEFRLASLSRQVAQ